MLTCCRGLVQVAVGFAKLSGGSPKGTVKLLQTGSEKLMMYAPEAYGLDITSFLELTKTWRGVAEQMIERGGAAGVTLPEAALQKKSDDG